MNVEDQTPTGIAGTFQKLTRLLAAPTIDPGQRATRIQAVERDIVLPLRLLIIGILTYFFFFSGWLVKPQTAGNLTTALHNHPHPTNQAAQVQVNDAQTASNLTNAIHNHVHPDSQLPQVAVDDWSLSHADVIKGYFQAYAALNLVFAAILIWAPHLTLKRIEALVFAVGVLDAVLMGTLILLSRGFDSILYLVFPVIILHNALGIPVAFPQLLLNFIVCVAFMVGGLLDLIYIAPNDVLTDPRVEKPAERLIVLVAWALCCYGIQVLFEKQKRAEAEATELAVRQERLHTAGRLAAEIAHNIKNPLGIITNAAFSLQRAVHAGELAVDEQIEIIREEVEHADRIITELMGYAQLAEGRVERLEVAAEIDSAILEIFPPAAKYRVEIAKHVEPSLPALLMQRRHLSSVLTNLMQNAREAMNGVGRLEVNARYGANDSVVITIGDNGPGIAPDKMDKIYEAHFSTRVKGTGLGLAIVKHNTEIYGGTVKVDSELGKGTRFTLEFPARILMRLSK